MPSPLHVPVTTITAIKPHPNADQLEIAQVLGWQCVVQRGRYHAGDNVVYFPIDTLLPREFSDRLGVTQYLHKQRIKATRLRGEASFGLIMPCERDDWNVGDNVAEYYAVTKYEPPTREEKRCEPGQGKFIPNPDHLPRNPLFAEYTAINNLRHFPDLLGRDELVVVTEKLHGTNSRIGMIDGEWMAGSHHVRRGQGDALYWSPRKHAEQLVSELAKYHRQVVLFGEILGRDVQSLHYDYDGHDGYRAFDLFVDGRYVDIHTFTGICIQYQVPMVPIIFFDHYDFDAVVHAAQGKTLLGADHIKEGVVIRPLVERYDDRVGRVILKYVSDAYLLARHSDFAEV